MLNRQRCLVVTALRSGKPKSLTLREQIPPRHCRHDEDAGSLKFMNPTSDPSARCPSCGGPTREVHVSIDFWRGGVEPVAVLACEDVSCDAYHPATPTNPPTKRRF